MAWEHRPTRAGATAYGAHFFKSWDSCRRYWWLKTRAPHPDGEGLSPLYTGSALHIGVGVHEGLAAYYASAPTTGDYDPEAAVRAAEASLAQRLDQWTDRTSYEADLAQVRSLLYDYHDWWGPGSPLCDWPDLQVVVDDQGPVIEREFQVPLPGGFVFTCRVDALVRFNGWLYVLEHKTSSPQQVGNLRTGMRMDSQATGECMVLQHAFPGEPIHGVLLNILVKGRGARSKYPPFLRDPIPRTQAEIAQLERDITRKHFEILKANEEYDALVDQGTDPWEAGRRVFPLDGTSNGLCRRYNRKCEYQELCTMLGFEPQLTSGFKAAIVPPPANPEEDQ